MLDSQYANLQSQLLKRSEEFEEMKRSLDDSVQKLRAEAERALAFEKNLERCTENLQAEKIARQNAEISAASAQARITTQEQEARELQAIINSLSNGADDSATRLLKLSEEKKKLENQVKDLQANLREATMTPAPARRGPRRTSSLSDARHIFLEQELTELRAAYSKVEAELHTAREELQRSQASLCNTENERIVAEKRLKERVQELENVLESQEEELLMLKSQAGGDATAQREEDLLYRIEQEEAKVATLNQMVDSLEQEARSLRKKIGVEASHAADLESRNVDLMSKKERALHELHDTEVKLKAALETQIDQLQAAIQPQLLVSQREEGKAYPEPEDPDIIATVERLLKAVERLRSERDGLRRDLEFLQMESAITVQTLEKRLSAMKDREQELPLAAQLHEEIDTLQTRLAESDAQHSRLLSQKDDDIKRLEARASTLASSIEESQRKADQLIAENADLDKQLNEARHSIREAEDASRSRERELTAMKTAMDGTQTRITSALEEVRALQCEREELLHRVRQLQDELTSSTQELASTRRELRQTEGNLQEALKSLEIVESQRESLITEVTNLQSDLEAARHELEDAEQRNDTLQAKQLASFSSYEATKALRQQIETLEQRVQRRTEQIGIHQHDIKRLELNLKLQEDRVNEMVAELETMASQKEAMVEDCAAAREARDDALTRVEALELELETVDSRVMDAEEARQSECAALIGVWAQSMSRLRATRVLLQHNTQRAVPETRPMDVDDSHLAEELNSLRTEHRKCLDDLEGKSASLRSLQASSTATSEDLRLVTVALASARAGLCTASEATTAVRMELVNVRSRCEALEAEAQSKSAEISALAEQREQSELRCVDAIMQKEALVDDNAKLQQQLLELQRTSEDSAVQLKEEVEKLLRAQDDMELRLSQAFAKSQSEDLRDELDALKAAHSQELVKLQDELAITLRDLEEAQRCRDALETQIRETEQTREAMEARLSDAENRFQNQLSELEAKYAEELCKTGADLQQEIDRLTDVLRKSEASHANATVEIERLRENHERQHSDLRQQLARSQDELQATLDELHSMREEKSMLDTEFKKTASQIENLLSMKSYLEDKLKDSESAVSSLREQSDRLKSSLIRSEKAEKTAEMNLSLQSTQHEHVVATLKREIERLKSRPDFEAEALELRERIDEMDQLLRSKSAEIEENDDKCIELLKEKKKLAHKVETLTRKVQSLQMKLSSAQGSSSTPEEVNHVFSRLSPARGTMPPVPPLLAQPASSILATPSGRTRTISGPSSLPRPKTPDFKATHFSTARMKTPEQRNPFYQPPAEASSSVAGKKRPVPEDFDDCGSVPPQGIVAERLVTFGEENATPRVRRPYHNARTGFTPQRSGALASGSKQQSPVRRMTTGAPSAAISDVTNSPRGASRASSGVTKSLKSGWLGKIRGASSTQPGHRTFSSRPPSRNEPSGHS
ncbi:hypothetical protein GLOTRDRAFT_30047 [Gloeophyllum trabeum ATCC 11539]|uniref:Uncharacterized protein n=1 Tax=Gloeophyllum trabeum (strain ATCC 11539 / FP-39264 / Madison 617) TaxID=670483 RepID=S7QLL3_GLOTA|nr:uncharacterized protein GLOTRDRAFT_30047 [Gloeophyllum trabeum ATCC 11539]EPQ60283.1 hypothetical protein GLOTRDRAFT_30047 [Gloeophyllum trabeum ATCC 11539]